jgi:KUP system potassium uptake protein
MEGLSLLSRSLDSAVLPLAIIVLTGLFAVQRFGTSKVGRFFGPLVMLWFIVIGMLGIPFIIKKPAILRALSPSYGVEFFLKSPLDAFYSLGSVVLVMTGGEAAYADLGHFGAMPIRIAWFTVAMPCLLLNYMGQGVLILEQPHFEDPPFFLMAPAGCTLPLILLATVAACIASQALISGVFSLARQAILLGYLPRLRIEHTSKKDIGQIYVPVVNWALYVCVIILVLGFGSSNSLASAYGLAICCIMVLTTILAFFALKIDNIVFRTIVRGTLMFLLCICILFLAANAVKIPSGGWVPLVLAVVVGSLIMSWRRGKRALQDYMERTLQPLNDLLEDLEENPLPRVPGVGVYLTARQDVVPLAMRQNLRHHQALHSTLILVTIESADVPIVPAKVRNVITHSAPNVWQIEATFGYMQEPDIPRLMRSVADEFDSIDFDDDDVSYFISREIVKFTFDENKTHNLYPVEHIVFNWMHRNAQRSAEFFRIQPESSIEVGTELVL